MQPRKKLNLFPWMRTLSIKNKDAKLERFPLYEGSEFYWAQSVFLREVERQYNAGKPIRIIVLKCRQIGISTATEGLLFLWSFLFPGTNSLVLSKDRENTETIFEMTKLMWDTWAFKSLFTTSRKSSRRLSFEETLSNIRVATAKGDQVGRGTTVRAVHGSEVAFWEDPDAIMGPLTEAIPHKPGTIIVLESTANGVGGFFYETWMAAERGESEYVPLFFPWWRHSEYQVKKHNLTPRMLTEKEKALAERFDLNLAQLAWRRRKIRTTFNGDEDLFDQEYPASPEMAFLSTGRNVFDLESLADCYLAPGAANKAGQVVGVTRGRLMNHGGTLKLYHEPKGELLVFKTPDPSGRIKYVVAADPARTTEGDPCCIQVLRRDTLEQVAVWHGWATQNVLAEEIANLAHWYNDAIVNCEIEGGGGGVIAVLQHLGVPNIWRWRLPDRPLHKRGNVLGWSTNFKTKSWGIGQLQHYISKRQLMLHDATTYHALREYVNIDGVEMGPAGRDGHDDSVMALMIALMTTITEDPVNYAEIYGMGQLAIDQIRAEQPAANYDPVELEMDTGGWGEIE